VLSPFAVPTIEVYPQLCVVEFEAIGPLRINYGYRSRGGVPAPRFVILGDTLDAVRAGKSLEAQTSGASS
jgi:hypothetical protein